MTGCKRAPTHSAHKLTTAVRKSQNTKALFTSLGGSCDPPGLWKTVAGAHSHSRKTVDHLLHRRLVGKVEHDRRCTARGEMTRHITEWWRTAVGRVGGAVIGAPTHCGWPWRPPWPCSAAGSVWRISPESRWTSTCHVGPLCMLRPSSRREKRKNLNFYFSFIISVIRHCLVSVSYNNS